MGNMYIICRPSSMSPWTIKYGSFRDWLKTSLPILNHKKTKWIFFCEKNRYWATVLGGSVSSDLIILLLLYFTASYYRRIHNYRYQSLKIWVSQDLSIIFHSEWLSRVLAWTDWYRWIGSRVTTRKLLKSDRSSKRGSVLISNDVTGSI